MKKINDLKSEILSSTASDRESLANSKIVVIILSIIVVVFLLLVFHGFSLSRIVNESILSLWGIVVVSIGWWIFVGLKMHIFKYLLIQPLEKKIASKADDLARQFFFQCVERMMALPIMLHGIPKEECLEYVEKKLKEVYGFAEIDKSGEVIVNLFLDISDDAQILGTFHIQSINIYDERDWQNQLVPEDVVAVEICYQQAQVYNVETGSGMNITEKTETYFV
ncbi:MAG: hypothetical protein WCP92_03505 [bacterium]